MGNTIDFMIGNTGNSPSKSIWGDCPWRDIREGVVDGIADHFEFAHFRTSTDINAATAHWTRGYKVFGSSGAAIAAVDAQGGGMTFSSDGDDEGASVGDMGFPLQISRAHYKLWFEAQIKASTIADTKNGFFLGLGEAMALSATVPIAAAGTLADQNFVGFHRLEGDGDYVNTVYKADGVTQVTLQQDAQVLVADTWIKLGMRFIPRGDKAGDFRLVFYANGERLTTSYEVPSADGTDFPNDVRLGRIFAVLNATGSTPGSAAIRWWRMAQVW